MRENKLFITVNFFCLILFFSTNPLLAAPTPQMAKEVVDYYYNGQEEGPILMEAKICNSLEKLDCIEESPSKNFSSGETITVWMKFLVPKGATYDDILVEYKYNNVVWRVTPYKIEGSIRYRVIDKYKPGKVGRWTISIKKGAKELKSFTINITEKD